VPEYFTRDIESFFEREKWALGTTVSNADDQPIEQTRRAPDEVFMTARKRIESSGVNGNVHHA
jgi:hypothetical protein